MTTGAINSLDRFIPQTYRNQLQAQAWQAFQNNIDVRLQMFRDDWEHFLIRHIKDKLSEESKAHFFPRHKRPLWPLPLHVNVIKRVITETSIVYTSNATRKMETETDQLGADGVTLEQAFASDERFAEVIGGDYNAKMQLVNQLTNLCNVVLVRPVPDQNEQTGFRLDVLTPDQFTPIQDPDNPSRLIGALYTIDMTDTPGRAAGAVFTSHRREVLIYMGKAAEEPFIVELEPGDLSTPEKQPYPFVYKGKKYFPFAIFRADQPLTGEFINRTAGNDLVSATLETARLLSYWMRAFVEQSGKQIVVSGPSADKMPVSYHKDNMAVLQLPVAKDDAIISQLDHSVDLNGQWKALESYIESAITQYGLSIDSFKGVVSGIALKLKNEKLINRIKSQYANYRLAEKQLADIIMMENNRVFPTGQFKPINDQAEFMIDFGDLPFEPEAIEMVQNYSDLVNMNVMSMAEVLQRFNPDIGSVEDAQEQLQKNRLLNQRAKGKSELNFQSQDITKPVTTAGVKPLPEAVNGETTRPL